MASLEEYAEKAAAQESYMREQNVKTNAALGPDTVSGHENDCGAMQAAMGYSPYRKPTLREDMEAQQQADVLRVDLRRQAITFLSAYPQFDEFIALIRKGAIRI